MDMKWIVALGLRAVAGILVLGTVAGCWPPAQILAAAPPAQSSRTTSQPTAEGAAGSSRVTTVTKVLVSRQQQKTIVQVSTRGAAVYQATHLSGPERVVIDFQRARLAIPATTPSSYGPVFRIRAGQFKPDVVRVVIDLQEIAPYRINLEENTVTVEFGATESATAPSPTPSPGPPAEAGGRSQKSLTAPKATGAQPRSVTAERAPMPAPPRAARAPANNVPLPVEPGFSNGMLTFRVQNQTLRSALAGISAQSGIAINMGNDLGNEPLSVDFRHYRVDEALRQMLKDYDTFFFYAGDNGNQEATSLRAVWVYPEGRGPRFASFK
jgi:hypothetical protein